MKLNLKKTLLAGSAIVAVSAFAPQAFAADGAQVAVDTTVSADEVGDAGAGAADGAAGNNGDDGIELITNEDIDLILSGTGTDATGGAGQDGPVDADDSDGNAGGNGGIGINTATVDGTSADDGDHQTITTGAGTTVTGGAGGAGGDGGDADADGAAGGNGGNGGDAINLDSNFATLDSASTTVTGGAGGAGGDAADGTGDDQNESGGDGGVGGQAIDIVSDDNIIEITAGTVTGGAGGAGGASVGTAANSDGGAAGAGIDVDGADASITIGSGVTVRGGAGGAAGTGGSGAAGAAGADGVGISIDGTGSTLVNGGTIAGGDSGSAIAIDINAAMAALTNTGLIGNATTHAGNAVDLANVTLTTLTNTGTIAVSSGRAVNIASGGTITTLNNTNGDITATTGTGLHVDGTVTTLNNTSGTISATTGQALVIDDDGDINAFINTGGTITSANTGDGTFEIANDIGALTIFGGTIRNTDATDTSNAIGFTTADQTGTITFDGVTIISDGDTANSGQGVAIDLNGQDAALVFDADTVVRGQIISTAGGLLSLTTSGTITSGATNAITTNDQADVLVVEAGEINGNINLGAGNNDFTLNGGTVTGTLTTGAGNDDLIFDGGSLVGATDLAGGANTMNVTGTFATGGTFTTSSAIALTVGAVGNFTADHTMALGTGTVGVTAGGLFTVNEDVTTTGALTNAGTLTVGPGAILSVGDHTASTGTFVIQVADATTFGSIVVDDGGGGTPNFDFTGSSLEVDVVGSNFIADGAELLIVNGESQVADLTAVGEAVEDNSFIYDFLFTRGDHADIAGSDTDAYLIVDRLALASTAVSTTSNNAAVGAVLDDLGTNGDARLDQVQANLGSASTQEEVNEILESVTPTVDGGAAVAAVTVADLSADVNSDRLASLRSGETGMAAGNGAQGMKFWGQIFGQSADQDRRDNIDGYDADTYGLAFGLDTANLHDNGTIGVALSYGDTEVDSRNANNTNTEVDSYQVSLYGDYDLAPATFIEGMVAYAWNEIDQTRSNVGGAGGPTANADYDADQFTVRTKVGHDYAYDTMVLTPALLGHYTHYSADSYTETGAGGANLAVDQDTLQVLEVGVGVDAGWNMQQADGAVVKPEVRAAYRYDLIGDEVETTSNFTGGGAAFNTQGIEPARSRFTVGAGLTYETTTNWAFTASYDYDFRSDYDAHSGYLRAGYKF